MALVRGAAGAVLSAVALAWLVGGTAHASAPTAPPGVWLMQNGKAAVEFFRCGEKLCGRLRWGRPDQFPDGTTKDRRNPDPDQRERELCGATVIWDLEWKGDGRWGSGHVYDPTSGETYGAKMTVEGPEELRVRGYVLGISWFGKSQTWRPAPETVLQQLCTPPLS